MKRGTPARQRGAALLLLVAVLGLGAASLLIGAFGHDTGEAARQQRTLATLAQARDALLGFAVTHGRLPRPAASALAAAIGLSASLSASAADPLKVGFVYIGPIGDQNPPMTTPIRARPAM